MKAEEDECIDISDDEFDAVNANTSFTKNYKKLDKYSIP
jgi:hypothetical protein